MRFDMTFTVTVVIALSALFSPILTAIINNQHLRKMKKLDMQENNQNSYYLHKRELLETFLVCISNSTFDSDIDSTAKLNASYYKIIPYIPNEEIEKFNQIINSINKNENKESWWEYITQNILPVIRELLSESPEGK
ncbi:MULTISPECIES: hypothetical protein [unclassified Lactococcus]|uniref:hypothetical protein n=1 Tax=unclassified Lactococcus TaxID=2643510 RepID=UPI0011C9F834|nr:MULTISPECIES: hypothetical protein [unclassified Lactococcus]MQW23726.1 hypothetical protein [Lactococcus sp. dk101]TXK37479.1 hypothetical protein FVP42_08935 [Lactococcus sp. dk310]TXK48822.1 hypothetical protein FVP43_08910 [Lactococcus sp. dk322]